MASTRATFGALGSTWVKIQFPPRLAGIITLGITLISMLGCEPRLSEPTHLCYRQGSAACRPIHDVEAFVQDPQLRIETFNTLSERSQTGRARVVASSSSGPIRFMAKWRRLTHLHGHNDARREVAAYAIQKLFLEPPDYVVPPSSAYCMNAEDYRKHTGSDDPPVYEGTRCVMGILSYWLTQARPFDRSGLFGPSTLIDRRRFEQDASYRRSLANVNLLASIMGNGDTHRGQFVIAGSPSQWHIYAVDHTISLTHYRSLSLSDDEYLSIIQVPALPRSSIETLRARTSNDFERLAVVNQFMRVDGGLVPAQLKAPGGNLEHGLRWVDDELQLGLTQSEIDLLWNRTQDLLSRVDRGEIPLY